MKRKIIIGAWIGATAWLFYFAVESFLTIVLSQLVWHRRALLGWQLPLIALILGVYILGGVLLGAFGALVLNCGHRKANRQEHQMFAGLMLAVAFLINLLAGPKLTSSAYVAFTIGVGVAVLVGASLVWAKVRKRTSFLANPWAVTMLILAAPWTNQQLSQEYSGPSKVIFIACALATIIALAAIASRIHLGQRLRAHMKVTVFGCALAAVCSWMMMVATEHPIPLRPTATGGRSDKPNIVLITMDTVRADHLSLYGYHRDTTPNLRGFGREATIYRSAVAASSFTLPSHGSIFTGLYPRWHGAIISVPEYPHGRPLPDGTVTLAGLLRKNGYRTVGIAANLPYLQANTGLAQGFDVWDVQMPVSLSTASFYLREGVIRLLHSFMNTAVFDTFYLRAADINQRAFTELDKLRNQGPFFLFLNYMDAHVPYTPPAPFCDEFPGRDRDFRPSSEVEMTTAVNTGKRSVRELERRHLISQYDGGIAYTDSQIGKLLVRLRELNFYENTLILITSDHGEAFGAHGLMQHGTGSVYEDQVRVPLVVKYPVQHQGRQSDALTSHVDILPTVLDVAGCLPPRGLQGRNLLHPRDDSDIVYAEAGAFGDYQAANPKLRGERRALYLGPWKLITPTVGGPELYNLVTDPSEIDNQYRSNKSVSTSLMNRMVAWAAGFPHRPNVRPSKALMGKIKSLGYVQGDSGQ
jgi:arylsulfatase A-like enzyme